MYVFTNQRGVGLWRDVFDAVRPSTAARSARTSKQWRHVHSLWTEASKSELQETRHRQTSGASGQHLWLRLPLPCAMWRIGKRSCRHSMIRSYMYKCNWIMAEPTEHSARALSGVCCRICCWHSAALSAVKVRYQAKVSWRVTWPWFTVTLHPSSVRCVVKVNNCLTARVVGFVKICIASKNKSNVLVNNALETVQYVLRIFTMTNHTT